MSTLKKNRIPLGAFDFVKGLGMIMIVMAHMMYYYDIQKLPVLQPLFFLFRLIGGGVNPLFFIVTGFGFKERPAKTMLKNTFHDLLIPYLWVAGFIAVLFPIVHTLCYHWLPGAIREDVRYILAFLLGVPGGTPHVIFGFELYECSVVYFLLSMFVAVNLTNLIVKIKKRPVEIALVAGCLVASDVLYRIGFNFFCLPQGLLAVTFCYTGYLMKKYNVLDLLRARKWLLLPLLAAGVAQSLFGCFGFAYGKFAQIYLDTIGSGCMGIVLMFCAVLLADKDWIVLEPFRKIGMYTYWLMCIHSVEMTCIPWYAWSAHMAAHPGLGFLIELCCKVGIMLVGCLILKKISRYRYAKKVKAAA